MAATEISVPAKDKLLKGNLCIPENAVALVIFSHGSGSSRFSPRNRYVAEILNLQGMATLLIDLLTEEEDSAYAMRFDIALLTTRLIAVAEYMHHFSATSAMPIGLFGASTGAASALKTAAALYGFIGAVVCRGGRPDLAADVLHLVKAPVLLLVGGWDGPVIEMNQSAFQRLACAKKLVIVEGATHLFEEAGKLEEVAQWATDWFQRYLVKKHV